MKVTVKKAYRLAAVFLCVLTVAALLPLPTRADTGPKPSVRVTFLGLGNEVCYGTLLSREPSTGPASAWDGDEQHIHLDNLDMDIWRAFVEYEDPDGFYFLQEAWQVNGTGELAWTYYPPDEFKILLYFPESGTFYVSGIYQRYAFDSYFTVNMEDVSIESADGHESSGGDHSIQAHRSYEYRKEILSLAARIVITILIEMAVALLFGYRERRQLMLLAGVNTVTQIMLNALLNLIHYRSGAMAFVINYFLFELIVFALEAVVFCIFLGRISVRKRSRWRAVGYALTANAVSFCAGLLIANWLPGIF